MGAGPSHGELADNDCLLRLAGELEITIDDPFWDTFLTFSLNPPTCRWVDNKLQKSLTSIYIGSVPLPFKHLSVFSQDDKMLTDRLKSICESLVVNNRNTSNFKTLIRLLLDKVDFQKLEAEEK